MGIKIKNYLGRNFKRRRIPDRQSATSRSSQMSKIHSKHTLFEDNFIKEFRKNYRGTFKTNVMTILGKPDIVIENKKLCIFLDSDFWHGWQYPRWKHLLKNNFWKFKIENNRDRDRKVTRKLRGLGWKVVRIWEHKINSNFKNALNKIWI